MKKLQSIDEHVKALSLWDAEIKEYELKAETARKKKEDILRLLLPISGKNFQNEGKFYLIKETKKTGAIFIVEFNQKPGSWLKKTK